MNKTTLKTLAFGMLLVAFAALMSSCYWWGPRRHWHRRYHDGGGWHEGYYR